MPLSKTLVATVLTVGLAAPAFADCTIKNDTKHDFTVKAGNVSNRAFGANNIQSFPRGPISGTSKSGKSFSATCNDREYLVVTEKDGAILVKPR